MYACVKVQEHEGSFSRTVVPSNWRRDGKVYWNNTINAKRSFKNREEINEAWDCYEELKLYLIDDLQSCEDVANGLVTTAEENSPEKEIFKDSERSPDKSLPDPPKKTNKTTEVYRSSSNSSDNEGVSSPSPSKKRKIPKHSAYRFVEDEVQVEDDVGGKKTPRKSLNFSETRRLRRSPRIANKTPPKSFRSTNNNMIKNSNQLRGTDFYRSPGSGSSQTRTPPKFNLGQFRGTDSHRSGSSQTRTPHNVNQGSSHLRSTSLNAKTNSQNAAAANKSRYPLETAEFQRKVLKLLLEIKSGVNDKVTSTDTIQMEKVQTIEELEDFESSLQDKEEFAKLKNTLSTIGGTNIRTTINRMLQTITDNAVLSLLNWDGTQAKTGFKNFPKIIKAINECIFKKFRGTTDHDVKKYIQNVLKDAPDREGGTRYQRKINEKNNN